MEDDRQGHGRASRSAMIAALRAASAARRRRRRVEVGLAGRGEHQPHQALAALGRIDGVVAREPADLLQRREPRRARRPGARRPAGAIQPISPSRASIRRGRRSPPRPWISAPAWASELDVHHPPRPELHLPGIGGGRLVRLGEPPAHVGGVGAAPWRRRAAGRAPRRSPRRPAGAELAAGRRRRGRGSAPGAPRSRPPRPGSGGRRRARWRPAPAGRRAAAACRPCRGRPRASARVRAPRSAPGSAARSRR